MFMKSLAAALMAVALGACAGQPVDHDQAFVHPIGWGVCPLLAGWGTATQLSESVAVTNHHASIMIADRDIIADDPGADLLYYRKAGPETHWGVPHIGDHVTMYGGDCFGQQVKSRAVITELVPAAAFTSCVDCSVARQVLLLRAEDSGQGFSGGPLVNDAGEIVGVTFAEITSIAHPEKAPGVKLGDMAAIPAPFVQAEYRRLTALK